MQDQSGLQTGLEGAPNCSMNVRNGRPNGLGLRDEKAGIVRDDRGKTVDPMQPMKIGESSAPFVFLLCACLSLGQLA